MYDACHRCPLRNRRHLFHPPVQSSDVQNAVPALRAGTRRDPCRGQSPRTGGCDVDNRRAMGWRDVGNRRETGGECGQSVCRRHISAASSPRQGPCLVPARTPPRAFHRPMMSRMYDACHRCPLRNRRHLFHPPVQRSNVQNAVPALRAGTRHGPHALVDGSPWQGCLERMV